MRALWQTYRLRWLQLLCPPNDDGCLPLLENEIAQLYRDFNLYPVQRMTGSITLIGIVPADRLDAIIGILLCSLFLCVSIIFFALMVRKGMEFNLLLVINICVIVWCIVRIAFWCMAYFIGWDGFVPVLGANLMTMSGEAIGAYDPRKASVILVAIWLEVVILTSQLLMFGLLLVDWSVALQQLLEFPARPIAFIRLSVWIVFGLCVTLLVVVSAMVTRQIQSLHYLAYILIWSFRVVLVVSMLFNFVTLLCCCIGLAVLYKARRTLDAIGIVKMMVLLAFILVGLVFRALFWFSDLAFFRMFESGPG